MNKNLIIRADANLRIGTGHVMRCVALAQAWQDLGGSITFVSRCESDALKKRVRGEKFGLIEIESVCPDTSDLKSTLTILKNATTVQESWLVLDGYHFIPEYQRSLRQNGYRLIVIDDMNHLPHYHADIVLNQNINAPDLKYHCDKDTELLLGTRYVLLRREFMKYIGFKRRIPERATNVLVTLGGSDPDNVTLKVIEALTVLNIQQISVKIIVGPANAHQETLQKALANANFKAELLVNPPNMPDIMAWADLAISACGSTCWELAFMGVPSLTIVIAENQRYIADSLENAEIFKTLGWHDAINSDVMVAELSVLIQDKKLRENESRLGRQLVDGNGAKNIVNIMSCWSTLSD
jgi:UDP-2,4-diacetamido-2,4,6-trideoxy-beta-L-altropyranose hydrolase